MISHREKIRAFLPRTRDVVVAYAFVCLLATMLPVRARASNAALSLPRTPLPLSCEAS